MMYKTGSKAETHQKLKVLRGPHGRFNSSQRQNPLVYQFLFSSKKIYDFFTTFRCQKNTMKRE